MKQVILLLLCHLTVFWVVSTRPNIILILTDDQDHFHGNDTSMNAMPQANALLGDVGIRFSNFYVNTPVCCPSRSELISGRFNHNIRMPTSKGGCMHMNSNTKEYEANTIATGLQKVGYRTGLFGKYLNTHAWFCDKGVRVVPGWDRFFASCKGVYYYNTWNDQGVMITNDTNLCGPPNAAGTNYNTAIVGNYSVKWIREVAMKKDKPFFAYIAPHAPHVGQHGGGGADVTATPAKWYNRSDIFANIRAPRKPNYNFSATEHHWLIAQQKPIMPGFEEDWIDELMRNRWRCLLSVDDLIVDVIRALKDTGVLDNTWIFYTSDHGQNLGHYRLPSCKLNVYEHDVRVPLLVRGPGIRPNTTINALAGNTDLAPTILDLAGGQKAINPLMDGKSLVPLLLNKNGENVWARDTYLIEYNVLGNVQRGAPGFHHLVDSTHSNQYRAVRVINHEKGQNLLLAEFTNQSDWNFTGPTFTEFFDLVQDPWQLNNIAATAPSKLVDEMRERLHDLWTCKAASCP